MYASLVRLITLGDVGPNGDFRDDILRGTDPRKAAYRELIEAGARAVPALIAQIKYPRVREALAEIGLPAVEPLLAALDTDAVADVGRTFIEFGLRRVNLPQVAQVANAPLLLKLRAEAENPLVLAQTLIALAQGYIALNVEKQPAIDILINRVARFADDGRQKLDNVAILDWLTTFGGLESQAGVMAFARVWRQTQSPTMQTLRDRLVQRPNTRRWLVEADATLPLLPTPVDNPTAASSAQRRPTPAHPPAPAPKVSIGVVRKFEDWLPLLESPDVLTAGGAATALGDLGDRRAFLPLIKCIAPDHPFAPKARAALALGKLGSKAAIAPLQTLANAKLDSYTTHAAEQAIEMLKGKP